MKKFFLFMLMAIALGMTAGLTSCTSCGKGEPKEPVVLTDSVSGTPAGYDGVLADFTAGTDKIVALQRQTMYNLIDGKPYEWRNLRVVFNDEITAETLDDLHVTDVTSVFYYWDNGPWVQYVTSNIECGTYVPARIPDVWIEDCDMSEAEIKLSAEDVLKRLKEWNGVIPQAKGMVLRLPVGPRRCNAQWVIGGIGYVIFVDAVTGDITDWCPAFPIPNVNGPLGEWP